MRTVDTGAGLKFYGLLRVHWAATVLLLQHMDESIFSDRQAGGIAEPNSLGTSILVSTLFLSE
jgi:hypothetical protein